MTSMFTSRIDETPEPARISHGDFHYKCYHDPDTGLKWKVVSSFYEEGSAEAAGATSDPIPYFPGFVVSQATFLWDGDEWVPFRPLDSCD